MPARKRSAPAKKPAKKPKSPAKRFWKGAASKSRPGRLDFVTHKGSKFFDRDGHRESHAQGSLVFSNPFARPKRRMRY